MGQVWVLADSNNEPFGPLLVAEAAKPSCSVLLHQCRALPPGGLVALTWPLWGLPEFRNMHSRVGAKAVVGCCVVEPIGLVALKSKGFYLNDAPLGTFRQASA